MSSLTLKLQQHETLLATIATAIIFNVVWAVCIVWSAYALVAVVAGLVCNGAVFWRLSEAPKKAMRAELAWVVVMVGVGFTFETTLQQAEVLLMVDEGHYGVPFWLVCLWVAFAQTFRYGLRFLLATPWLLPLCGALATFSYFAGAQIQPDVQLALPVWRSLVVIACAWTLVLPLLVYLYAKRFYCV